jgi:hypothetical protein
MSEPLNDFLAKRLTLPALAGWAARVSERQFASDSKFEWLTKARLEQTHQQLKLAMERLIRYDLRPSRLCWVFEHLRIYFAARPDGTSLACYVENKPDIQVIEVEKVLEDFLGR